jgi:rRNA small subunit pseudouridine methyltransferase Nep1
MQGEWRPPVRLLLAEASLELMPPEIWDEPDVRAYCRRRGKSPRWTLLDSSYHHRAMKKLSGTEKRGRPDIVHMTLLEALGSPLNLEGLLSVHVHTLSGHWIKIDPTTRLPRVYDRFKGLMEKLLREGKVVTEDGKVLLESERRSFGEVLEELGRHPVVLLHESGEEMSDSVLENLVGEGGMILVVGCFPHGDFSREVMEAADFKLRVHDSRLDAWVATSRALCALENLLLKRK